MAANLLISVQDALKREYDYIVVGTYILLSYLTSNIRVL